MKKWIIRPNRSSPYMLAYRDSLSHKYTWTMNKEDALKFDTRMEAVEVAFKHKGDVDGIVVMEIET